MFCGRCGHQIEEGARFCSACGAPTVGATTAEASSYTSVGNAPWTTPAANQPVGASDWASRLQRPRANRIIAGVCAGLAKHYRWDLTLTRVMTVLIAVFSSGAGILAYLVFWMVMPEEPWALPPTAGPSNPPIQL